MLFARSARVLQAGRMMGLSARRVLALLWLLLHDPVSFENAYARIEAFFSHRTANELHHVEIQHGKAPNDGEEGQRPPRMIGTFASHSGVIWWIVCHQDIVSILDSSFAVVPTMTSSPPRICVTQEILTCEIAMGRRFTIARSSSYCRLSQFQCFGCLQDLVWWGQKDPGISGTLVQVIYGVVVRSTASLVILCFTRQGRNPTKRSVGTLGSKNPPYCCSTAHGSTFKAEGSAGTFLHRWTEHYGRKEQEARSKTQDARRKMQDARSRVAHQWGISGCKIATGPVISFTLGRILAGIASGQNWRVIANRWHACTVVRAQFYDILALLFVIDMLTTLDYVVAEVRIEADGCFRCGPCWHEGGG